MLRYSSTNFEIHLVNGQKNRQTKKSRQTDWCKVAYVFLDELDTFELSNAWDVWSICRRTWRLVPLMGCLHDPANVQQISSKCIQNTRANAGRLLDVCWIV